MDINVLYVPSYSIHKTSNITPLEQRLKSYVIENGFRISSWISGPQAQEEFDFETYLNILQRTIIEFINAHDYQTIRIIGASFGAGVVHYILSNIKMKNKLKIFLFKPILINRYSSLIKIKTFRIVNYPQNCSIKSNFTISPHDIFYVFGDKDLLTGSPTDLFYSINDKSKIQVLLNSVHSSKDDEFPKFESFFNSFMS